MQAMADGSPSPRIKLVLVDDHPIVLQGLQQFLERHDDCDVVACCPNADAGFFAVQRHHPDVLILDLRMPGRDGLSLLRSLSASDIPCRTVLLTAAISEAEVEDAVKLGVRGLVLKDSPPETIVGCVRRVATGDQWFDRGVVTRALTTVMSRESSAQQMSVTLTSREIEIVRMVAQGLRNRIIASRLSISEGTVKVHLHNIYEKLGVDGRLELTICAQQNGLL
jgi:DNA-binding NarL/FixJ family response regulator